MVYTKTSKEMRTNPFFEKSVSSYRTMGNTCHKTAKYRYIECTVDLVR